MKLFKYEGFKVSISPEALMLKPFKRLWERDKTETKSKALAELAFIYFHSDPRSDYMNILGDESRMEEIKKGEGLKENWEPDKLVLEAIDLYKKLTVTAASGLLEDARHGIEKIREQIREISFDDIDASKLPKALKDIADTLTRIPDLIGAMQKAEKALYAEIQDNSRMRGQGSKTIFEDGYGSGDNNN